MRIVCAAASSIPSRSANSIQVMKACQGLAQLGHDVHLLVPKINSGSANPSPTWQHLADHYGLSTYFTITWLPANPALKRYDLAWNTVRQASKLGADIFYTWMLQAAVLALSSALHTLLEVHDRITGRIGPLLFRQYLRSRGKKRLLPITQALRRVLERDFSTIFPENEVVISPNGATLEQYANLPDAAVARQMLGLPDRPTAAYSGHFYAGRGLDMLFALAEAIPQANFLWVGGQVNDVAACRIRLDQQRLQNVTLTGFIENARLPRYQAAADVLLAPYERSIAGSSGGNSADICSPMKLFDYMAAGRAILCSDLPVIHEVLNSSNAVFCPPEETAAWQQALVDLLTDVPRREALAQQARLDAAGYSWQARERKALAGF
jgi:glycosyltransferase involved in cell wall biosynthesis